jgi:sugar phosphate isomerase/epimerase
MLSRRNFLAASLAAPALAAQSRLKIGVMDGVLKASGRPESVALAKSMGCEGLQVTLGRPKDGETLPLEDKELQASFVAESKKHSLPLVATYLDVLHVNCLKSDPLARKWVRKGIEITRDLRAGILMTVFFGKCSVTNRQELEYVAGVFKELAPAAESAGVILGFENLLNAEDNARAMDRVGSRAFQIYYDVGNATNLVGVDAPSEIRRLGRDRICQFHFKDQGYLGEGKVDFAAVLKACSDIGFSGYANLETSSPSGSMDNDLKRNLAYLRGLMK